MARGRVLAAGLWLVAGVAMADITGGGITVNINGSAAGVNTVTFTGNPNVYAIGDSGPITPGNYTAPAALVGPIGSALGNEATVGTFSVTPAFQRSDYKWDTEQLWVESPKRERVVFEGRAGNRGATGDIEAQIYQISYTTSNASLDFQSFVGNPTPNAQNIGIKTGFNATTGNPFSYSYTSTPFGSSQQAFVSGQVIPFSVTYNGTSRIVQYNYGNGSITYTIPVSEVFDGVLLRVNVADFTSVGNRSLSLANMQLEALDGSGNVIGTEDLVSDVTGTNALTASAYSAGALDPSGQRQFTYWSDPALSDDASWRLRGNATFMWDTAAAPSGSGVAFQFKLVDAIAPVPEPATLGLLLLAAGVLWRRRRA